jgi:hypothetical protein
MTKRQFRVTKTWKNFRKEVLDEREYRCELCGVQRKSKQLDLHHVSETDYTLPDKDKVRVLCSGCHKWINILESRKDKTGTKYTRPIIGAFIGGDR